jgi:4-diphosphocytidyl-2-C-methyl-D-erythritol kinase
MTGTIGFTAPAKLTWTLRVTGVRADGYHLIDAEMISLDLADRVVITPADTTSITVDGPFADGVPTDSRNLCHRALSAAGRTARVHVHKTIPHGGGLGGGSTDAAAVLRWAGITDAETAAAIGADVPFCLRGGRARVTGIGEILDPLPHLDRTVTLVIPPLTVSTPAVYRAWDDLGGPTADGPNDLEAAAFVVEPELRRWRDRIGSRCGDTPILAGSGATWFVPGRRDDALADLVDEGALVTVAASTAGY